MLLLDFVFGQCQLCMSFSRKQSFIIIIVLCNDKAQGQAFARVGMLLLDFAFGHGQLCLSFSRTQSFKNLIVVLPSKTKNATKNLEWMKC